MFRVAIVFFVLNFFTFDSDRSRVEKNTPVRKQLCSESLAIGSQAYVQRDIEHERKKLDRLMRTKGCKESKSQGPLIPVILTPKIVV